MLSLCLTTFLLRWQRKGSVGNNLQRPPKICLQEKCVEKHIKQKTWLINQLINRKDEKGWIQKEENGTFN